MYYYFTDHQNGKKGPAITNISKNICSKQYPHIQMGVDHNIINNLGKILLTFSYKVSIYPPAL